MPKEEKEDINHEEEMAHSLNEYKLDNQTLSLVKEIKEDFPIQAKLKVKMVPPITLLVMTPSAPLLEPPLDIDPPSIA